MTEENTHATAPGPGADGHRPAPAAAARPQLVFATNNAHKLEEIRAILGEKIDVLSLADIDCYGDIPETSNTLQGNALQKARFVYKNYGINCFADDTGLEVTYLKGAPGVHTARYAYADHNDTEANTDKLLREMKDADTREAQFRTVIALILDGRERLFQGVVRGEIATLRLGTEGFGYDPVFIPEDTGKTFAQLGPEMKNRISHRARAVEQLAAYLLRGENTGWSPV